MIIGRKYLQFFHEVRTLPIFIGIDCGNDTEKMATIQSYLSSKVILMTQWTPLHTVHQQQTKQMVERFT